MLLSADSRQMLKVKLLVTITEMSGASGRDINYRQAIKALLRSSAGSGLGGISNASSELIF